MFLRLDIFSMSNVQESKQMTSHKNDVLILPMRIFKLAGISFKEDLEGLE